MSEIKGNSQSLLNKSAPAISYLAALNPKQREAAKYGIRPGKTKNIDPLLVIAGASSGKTNTLAHRVAHFVINGADPHRILLLTFTRRAANEMKSRVLRVVAGALKGQKIDLPWAGTFHAVGAQLLREYASVIGLKRSFTIPDRSDSADLMDLVRHDLKQSKKKSRFPQKDTCLAIYSLAVNSGAPLERVLSCRFPWCAEWEDELRALFKGYGQAKRRQNVLDYDDLLLYWAEILKHEKLAAEVGGRFDHILVDEYQDTNRLQAKILLSLKPDGRGDYFPQQLTMNEISMKSVGDRL